MSGEQMVLPVVGQPMIDTDLIGALQALDDAGLVTWTRDTDTDEEMSGR